MRKTKLKNKALQVMYKPGKANVTGMVISAFAEIDKSLDKSFGMLGGKKTKKEDSEKKTEKEDDEKKDE